MKFSWKKINNKLKWDPIEVVDYFMSIHYGYEAFAIPRGPCFILNLKNLFTDEDYYTTVELYLYLELASKRNIFDYKLRGVRYLPAAFAEQYQLNEIQNSKLFELKDNNIHFKYEQEKQYVD